MALGLSVSVKNKKIRNELNIDCIKCTFSEPTTSIYGGPDIHVHEGSPVNLSCVVSQAVGQPEFFFWYHNGQVKYSSYSFLIQFFSNIR